MIRPSPVHLIADLALRMCVTPISNTAEAHNTIYVYSVLLSIAHFFGSSFKIFPERYIRGSKAKGRADYSIEYQDGEILEVTEERKVMVLSLTLADR